MRGYINIPQTIYCKRCKECGARPVVAPVSDIGYVVKCSNDDRHYQTVAGLIDIDDWNQHNSVTVSKAKFSLVPVIAW